MNLFTIPLALSSLDAKDVPRLKSRRFRNGNVIIQNKSNEFIKVTLEFRVQKLDQ